MRTTRREGKRWEGDKRNRRLTMKEIGNVGEGKVTRRDKRQFLSQIRVNFSLPFPVQAFITSGSLTNNQTRPSNHQLQLWPSAPPLPTVAASEKEQGSNQKVRQIFLSKGRYHLLPKLGFYCNGDSETGIFSSLIDRNRDCYYPSPLSVSRFCSFAYASLRRLLSSVKGQTGETVAAEWTPQRAPSPRPSLTRARMSKDN